MNMTNSLIDQVGTVIRDSDRGKLSRKDIERIGAAIIGAGWTPPHPAIHTYHDSRLR